jgi:hypothetical protein
MDYETHALFTVTVQLTATIGHVILVFQLGHLFDRLNNLLLHFIPTEDSLQQ